MTKSIGMATLIGSRICHDLISPLGAIGNGVELMEMAGVEDTPEFALIRESVQSASARLRFFRIAFGVGDSAQTIAGTELLDILRIMSSDGKHVVDWQVVGGLPRDQVKLAFLCLQCLESVMPVGGRISVTRDATGIWSLVATAPRWRAADALWLTFENPTDPEVLAPSDVQFALAPLQGFDMGRLPKATREETQIVIAF